MFDLGTVLISGLMVGGIYVLVSLGLNLIFGVVRIVNFAQGELVMLGMYAAFYLNRWLGLDPYLALVLIAPAGFLFGVAIQRLLIEPLQDKPMMQTFATFGLSMLLVNLVLAGTRGEALSLRSGLSSRFVSLGGIDVPYDRLVTFLAALAATVALHLFLSRTMLGKAIRAVTQDRMAARAVGANVERIYLLTFGLGTALACVAGALLAPIYTLSPAIGGNFMLAAFAVVILGGLGSIWGSLVGGILVGLLEILSGFYIDPSLKSAIWFSIFFIVLIVRPAGLFGRIGAEEVGFRAH